MPAAVAAPTTALKLARITNELRIDLEAWNRSVLMNAVVLFDWKGNPSGLFRSSNLGYRLCAGVSSHLVPNWFIILCAFAMQCRDGWLSEREKKARCLGPAARSESLLHGQDVKDSRLECEKAAALSMQSFRIVLQEPEEEVSVRECVCVCVCECVREEKKT